MAVLTRKVGQSGLAASEGGAGESCTLGDRGSTCPESRADGGVTEHCSRHVGLSLTRVLLYVQCGAESGTKW